MPIINKYIIRKINQHHFNKKAIYLFAINVLIYAEQGK